MDPTRQDASLEALAYMHPGVMVLVILLSIAVYTTGMTLRQQRVRRQEQDPTARRRHLLFAQPMAVVLVIGFLLGPISSVWLRGWPLMSTTHGWIGLAAAVACTAAAVLGVRLELEKSDQNVLHGVTGLIATMLGLVAAVSGIALLP